MVPRFKNNRWGRRAALAVVLAGSWPGTGALAQGCPSMPAPVATLEAVQQTPVYRNDRSRVEVARRAGPELPGYSQQGLTEVETAFGLGLGVHVASLGGNRYCVALARVEARWELSRITVDIVREHQPGSCPYAVIRAHESQHVALAQRLFARHAGAVRARLMQLVRAAKPLSTTLPPARALEAWRERLVQDMQPAIAGFQRDLDRANAQLDSADNYRKESAKCPRWD